MIRESQIVNPKSISRHRVVYLACPSLNTAREIEQLPKVPLLAEVLQSLHTADAVVANQDCGQLWVERRMAAG
jgi:hypothetical protein